MKKKNDILEQLCLNMKNDKWNVKLWRWMELQRWLLYCIVTNNRVCRYFKQKYSNAKDIVLIWRINRMLKTAKKEEVKMIDKVLKLWQ